VLLARSIAFTDLLTIQLQTCIIAHARVLYLFLLREVEFRNALEELLSNLGKERDFVLILPSQLVELSAYLHVKVCDLLFYFLAQPRVRIGCLLLLRSSGSQNLLIDERKLIALKIDLLLDALDGFVNLIQLKRNSEHVVL
jgi:hypothetical protein